MIEALNLLKEAETQLAPWGQVAFSDLTDKRGEVAALIRKKEFSLRSCLLDSFALMEAYLNGLAWDCLIEQGRRRLDDRDRQMLEDTGKVPFKKKILHYPRIVSGGRCILDERGKDVTFMLEVLKPTRDALTHPSPISPREQPEFSKLLMARYIEQTSLGYDAVTCTLNLMKSIEQRLDRADWPSARWLADLVSVHASIERPIDALGQ